MKLLTVLLVVLLNACASEQRTKYSDHAMRVFLDPDTIDEANYSLVQTALVNSGKFTVVDRGAAINAAIKEQDRLHKDQKDRFDNKGKYARMSRLLGAGGVVVARANCVVSPSIFNIYDGNLYCQQFLSLVDSSTGEVMVSVSGEAEGPSSIYDNKLMPSWNAVTEELVNKYPERFEKDHKTQRLKDYEDENEKLAQSNN